MEKMSLQNDINVFGFRVNTFPEKIGEAFETLMQSITQDKGRNYYGISYMQNDAVIYKVYAEEKFDGEAGQYNYETYIIEKGAYYFIALKNWRSKTGSIKDIFGEMMKDEHVDKTKPCIEWYKSDDEMLCMIKAIN